MVDEGHLFVETFPQLFHDRPPPDPEALLAPPRPDGPTHPPRPMQGVPGRMLALAGAAALAAAGTYTVQPGDTLSQLGARFEVPVDRLASTNGIVNLDRIYVGQRLSIPAAGRSGGTDGRRGARGAPDTPRYHTVRRGETLGGIAAKYGMRARVLARANDISDPGRILAGSRLVIHDAPATPPPTATAGSYRVRPGDTLSEIAARHRVSVAKLAAANRIADPNIILVGTKLKIPGGWHCPVPGATFVDDFGYRKPSGRIHEGIDLFAARGTPVRAPVSGRLDQVRGTRGGKQFFLEGDDGVMYIGTHMDAFVGKEGRVRAGDVVGRVGNTGNAHNTSPHLHFEMEHKGRDVNPYARLVDSCR